MTDIELEQEIRKTFLEDKDVETVSFQQVSKDYAQKDVLMSEQRFKDVAVYMSYIFYRGHVLVDYCRK